MCVWVIAIRWIPYWYIQAQDFLVSSMVYRAGYTQWTALCRGVGKVPLHLHLCEQSAHGRTGPCASTGWWCTAAMQSLL